jgi:uncharacterized membrane protein
VLPPIAEKYGDQLDILLVNVNTEQGSQLYLAAMDIYKRLAELPVVPALVVGDEILIGDQEIPAKLSGLIDDGISKGGIEWPGISGLNELIPVDSNTPALENEPALSTTPALTDQADITGQNFPGFIQKFLKDPLANSIAVVVLVGVVASVLVIFWMFYQSTMPVYRFPAWVIPVLCLFGMGIAGYLTYVEATRNIAFCGPIGDCNSVQQSPYAKIWGILPVGIFGLAGYLAIGITWIIQRFSQETPHRYSTIAVWGLALFGACFSIYLTFLEPFVIGATCAWCITSAIVITLILWAASPAALIAVAESSEE